MSQRLIYRLNDGTATETEFDLVRDSQLPDISALLYSMTRIDLRIMEVCLMEALERVSEALRTDVRVVAPEDPIPDWNAHGQSR